MRFFAIAFVLFTAAVGVFASPVVERKTPKSAAVILTELSNTVTPLANKLRYATHQNATQATLTPIISDIKTTVTGAVTDMKLLVGQSSSTILASLDGTAVLEASDIAALLAAVANLIFTAAYAVLNVVDGAIYSIIYDLLAMLGQVVFDMLFIMVFLDAGVLAPLLTLLQSIFSIITSLGLSSLLGDLLGGR